MSQVSKTLIQILKSGLSYRKLSYLRRHFHHVSRPSVIFLHHNHTQSNRFINQTHSSKKKLQPKLHHRVLSDEDKEADRKLMEDFDHLTEEDTFGDFEQETSVKQKRRVKKKEFGQTFDEKATKNSRYFSKSTDEFGSISDEHEFSGLDTNQRSNNKRKSRWRDTFGTLSPKPKDETNGYESFPEEDDKPHIRLSKHGRRYPPQWYGEKIEEFGKQGRVKDAIRVYDVWMLEKERVMPTTFVIAKLLIVLANAGYTKKAFQVYNQMKKMQIKTNDVIYSALFNACANSPWPDDGLKRATLLLEDMALKEIKPNSVVFNTMIKAFSVCGDARTAFLIADKYTAVQKLDSEAFCHILMAAIADKKAGFWHAVQIWRWMLIKHVKPNVQIYNLLLRAIKECDVGDPVLAQQLLLPINPAATMKLFKEDREGKRDILELAEKRDKTLVGDKDNKRSLLTNSNHSSSQDSCSGSLQTSTGKDVEIMDGNPFKIENVDKGIQKSVVENSEGFANERLPNILNPNEDFSRIVSISNVSTPQDRFLLVGGVTGFLADMNRNGIQSNIETFDQMLSLIPPEKEQHLLDVMVKEGVKPDIDLLTNLAYKRSLRRDYAAAKDILSLIAVHKLIPNMRTYSVLAMSCNSLWKGLELLDNMKTAGIEPNIRVMGALVRTSFIDFRYKQILLKIMDENGLKPDDKLLRSIENHMKKARSMILQMEKQGEESSKFKRLDADYENFKVFYQTWLTRMELDVPDHPWAPFREKVEAK